MKQYKNIATACCVLILMLAAFRGAPCYADENGLEEAMSIVESASIDQDNDRVFIALEKYYQAFKLLNDYKKEFPDSKRTDLYLFLVREKIKECKKSLETAISKMDKEVFGVETKPIIDKRKGILSGPSFGLFIGSFISKWTKGLLEYIKSFCERFVSFIGGSVSRFKRLFITTKKEEIEQRPFRTSAPSPKEEERGPQEPSQEKPEVTKEEPIRPIEKEEARPPEVKTVEEKKGGGEWVITRKREEVGYDFSTYAQDPDVKFTFNGEEFRLERPVFRKGDEMWISLETILPKTGAILLKMDENSFVVIRDDGTPLEFKAGDTTVKVNKTPYLTLSQAPRVYAGSFLVSIDSLAKILDVSYTYDASTNTVKFSKAQLEEFSTFTVAKPKVVPEKKPAALPEAKPLPPPDIKEELLPPEYQRDVDLDIDTTYTYLLDKFAHDRTRQADWYISGRAYDYTVYGRFRMRDIRGIDKQRFKEDGEFFSLYKDDLGFKFLDNQLTVPQLRTQSQPYFGLEVAHFYDRLNTQFIVGETDNTVSGPTNIGAVRYYGDIYALRQEYVDPHNLFKVGGMVLVHETRAENQTKSGSTTYPRRNLFYLVDTTTYLYPNLNLYYTHGFSNFVPENKINDRFRDDNWKVGISLDEKLYSFKTSYEHVGGQYASIGVPATYQNYEGADFSTSFRFAPNWSVALGGRANKNNVERNPRLQTNFDKSLTASTNLLFPWQQNVNLSHTITESKTRGGDVDSTGTRYRDYRVDYTKGWNNLTAQFSYDRYILDPLETSTGGSFTDSYALTLFQFYPALNNSYLRLYQDMRKTKTIADASYTTTLWNSDIGVRWNLISNLSASADYRVATTQKEAFKDTAFATLILGGEFKSSPVTTWTIEYNLTNYDLYNPENQTTKHYTVLFKARHVFDVVTPEKWGVVKVLVYRDLNSNGRHDEDEPGISNIRVHIIDGRAAYTNSKGLATIKRIVPGDRKVKIDLSRLPLDMAVRGAPPVQAVTVAPLRTSSVEFPIVSTGKIRGRVYIDMNKDAKFDKLEDEPLPNVRVYLMPSGKDTLTFSDGSYRIDYIYPGEHEVAVDLATVSSDYKLSSPEKIKVSLKEADTLTDLDFLFSSRPIIIEHFDKE
ncbi:MAG: hypothetical protein HZA30_04890 [Candidatus Omnitrophica bacterium]|nr:hypothetical protein [Candidatus Omnitrophota bacterium]